jgi:glycerol-3-phosphate dehydrogenase
MFGWPSGRVRLSDDPIGVHAADIFARIYSTWLSFMVNSNKISNASDIGFLTAAIGREARQLAIAMGAAPETFNLGSIPWTATFVAASMEGSWYEFGKKAGQYTKKRNNKTHKYVKELKENLESEGKILQILVDMKECLECAKLLNINLPILKKAYRIFYKAEK